MVVGISGSPRINGITSQAVKEILANINGDTKYISLSGKRISGCISCLGCVEDNQCVLKDDFIEISKQLLKAEAIIIGVPNYYNMPNALTHAFMERWFSFRHQDKFLLKDKAVVLLSTGYSKDEANSQTLKLMENFVLGNKMHMISKFLVGAYSQCYDCPPGRTCRVGNVVKDHGFVEEITSEMLPLQFHEQMDSVEKCHKAADLLNQYL